MAEISSDDINQILATTVSLFPGTDSESNDQKLTAATMALCVLCHSFEIDADTMAERAKLYYDKVGEMDVKPMTGRVLG